MLVQIAAIVVYGLSRPSALTFQSLGGFPIAHVAISVVVVCFKKCFAQLSISNVEMLRLLLLLKNGAAAS